jgi:hypothetical protein
MKAAKQFFIFFMISCCFFTKQSFAQQTYATPVAYMDDISKALDIVQQNLWDYTNAVSHNKNAKKVEKRRMEIVESIKSSKAFIFKMPSYKGDKSLRDSAYSYLKISYAVITEDYSKLVDMEEVAEQSYDAMEAYILAKKLALDKQDTSLRMLNNQYKLFAAANNITLSDAKDKTAQKLEAAGKVYDYYNEFYLIFFKTYKQEAYVMDALNKTNVSSLKQNSDALKKNAADGLLKTDASISFNSDATLKNACREALLFYKNEAEKNLPAIADFLIKKETFEKIKKTVESISASKRTKADIDTYNAAVADFNAATTVFNSNIQKINDGRTKILTKWNDTVNTFIDKHVPKNN